MTILMEPGVYVECRSCEEMVLLNDIDNRCICSICRWMDKLTDDQKAILKKYNITREDLEDMKKDFMYPEEPDKKEIIVNKLLDRKRWNKAYRKWMKRKQDI